MAINFVKSDDIRILRDIEQYYSTQIDEMPMNGKECYKPFGKAVVHLSELLLSQLCKGCYKAFFKGCKHLLSV